MMAGLETLTVGETLDLGSFTFTASDIVIFATSYDPQPFHIDEDAAAGTLFGTLSASGWQTAAVFVRCFNGALRARHPHVRLGQWQGFRDLQWIRPVRKGDTLTFLATLLAVEAVPEKPGWVLATWRGEGINQTGDAAYRLEANLLMGKR